MVARSDFEGEETLEGLVRKLTSVSPFSLIRYYLETNGKPGALQVWKRVETLFPSCDLFKFIPQGAACCADQCTSLRSTCSSLEHVAVSVPVPRPIIALGSRVSAIIRPFGDSCERLCRTWILHVLDADRHMRHDVGMCGPKLRRVERMYELDPAAADCSDYTSDGEFSIKE